MIQIPQINLSPSAGASAPLGGGRPASPNSIADVNIAEGLSQLSRLVRDYRADQKKAGQQRYEETVAQNPRTPDQLARTVVGANNTPAGVRTQDVIAAGAYPAQDALDAINVALAEGLESSTFDQLVRDSGGRLVNGWSAVGHVESVIAGVLPQDSVVRQSPEANALLAEGLPNLVRSYTAKYSRAYDEALRVQAEDDGAKSVARFLAGKLFSKGGWGIDAQREFNRLVDQDLQRHQGRRRVIVMQGVDKLVTQLLAQGQEERAQEVADALGFIQVNKQPLSSDTSSVGAVSSLASGNEDFTTPADFVLALQQRTERAVTRRLQREVDRQQEVLLVGQGVFRDSGVSRAMFDIASDPDANLLAVSPELRARFVQHMEANGTAEEVQLAALEAFSDIEATLLTREVNQDAARDSEKTVQFQKQVSRLRDPDAIDRLVSLELEDPDSAVSVEALGRASDRALTLRARLAGLPQDAFYKDALGTLQGFEQSAPSTPLGEAATAARRDFEVQAREAWTQAQGDPLSFQEAMQPLLDETVARQQSEASAYRQGKEEVQTAIASGLRTFQDVSELVASSPYLSPEEKAGYLDQNVKFQERRLALKQELTDPRKNLALTFFAQATEPLVQKSLVEGTTETGGLPDLVGAAAVHESLLTLQQDVDDWFESQASMLTGAEALVPALEEYIQRRSYELTLDLINTELREGVSGANAEGVQARVQQLEDVQARFIQTGGRAFGPGWQSREQQAADATRIISQGPASWDRKNPYVAELEGSKETVAVDGFYAGTSSLGAAESTHLEELLRSLKGTNSLRIVYEHWSYDKNSEVWLPKAVDEAPEAWRFLLERVAATSAPLGVDVGALMEGQYYVRPAYPDAQAMKRANRLENKALWRDTQPIYDYAPGDSRKFALYEDRAITILKHHGIRLNMGDTKVADLINPWVAPLIYPGSGGPASRFVRFMDDLSVQGVTAQREHADFLGLDRPEMTDEQFQEFFLNWQAFQLNRLQTYETKLAAAPN